MRIAMKQLLMCGLLFVVPNCKTACADEALIPHRQDRPPNRPYSPEEALDRMTVPAGFHVELVAAEPDIVNPVAFTFDDRGRIWVTESVEYPRSAPGKGRDRIKILEDTSGDGKADRVTVFADDLNIPSAIEVGYGGVWVVNAPDLLFYEEENGEAVSRKVILTGFGRTDTHELPSSLTWGPDGWLYGLNGVFNHCEIVSEGTKYRFNCALYRIHPRTHRFEVFCEGTSNPWGLVWDPHGSAIVSTCHWAKDHVFHFVETGYYKRQAGPYPPYTMKIGSISDHGHQKTAYCGLAYMDSEAYPAEYRDRLYIGNIHGGCINVDVLSRQGATYLSQEAPDFLTANDAWFMPVSIKMGPDGCLYILDWYDRYHCSQDARRDPEGVDRGTGRLYRVRYQDSPRARPFDLATESNDQLIEYLGHHNIFFRQRSQRLLSERNHPETIAKLEHLVLDGSTSDRARMHALWAIVGAGPLRPEFHLDLLDSVDSTLRAWGVRAAGNMREVEPSVRSRITSVVYDFSPDVQLQLAIASRKIEGLDGLAILTKIAASCGQDKLIPYIVWPNLHPLLAQEAQEFRELFRQVNLSSAPGLKRITPRAVDRLLDAAQYEIAIDLIWQVSRDDAEIAQQCLAELARHKEGLDAASTGRLAAAVAQLLQDWRQESKDQRLAQTAELLAASLGVGETNESHVRTMWMDRQNPTEVRLHALDVLISVDDDKLLETLPQTFEQNDSEFLAAALPRLGKIKTPELADALLTEYPSASPELQPLIIEVLMQRETWVSKILAKIQSKELPRGTLDAGHLRKILETNDRYAIWLVEDLWGKVRTDRNPDREKTVLQTLEMLQHAEGDVRAGERVFQRVCAQCHQLYGQGHTVGPDLSGNGRGSFQQLVSNVLDPSLVIGPGYQSMLVVTDDGRNLTGIPVEDNDEQIVLRVPGGTTQSIPRNSIMFVKKHPLSMMPEGLEQVLNRQELVDLFTFLSYNKDPNDPTAKRIPGTPVHGR